MTSNLLAMADSTLTLELKITGMSCSGCVRAVTDAIHSASGVDQASVDLDAGRAVVRWSEGNSANVDDVVRRVEAAGFGARPLTPADERDSSTESPKTWWERWREAGWRFNVVFAGSIAALLMIGEWALDLGGTRGFTLFAFVASTLVLGLCGARFYIGAWRQLRHGRSNMDTLVSLGATTAYLYSCWLLFSGHEGHAYFMEVAGIIALISLGHWMETLTSRRAGDALRSLMDLAPATAERVQENGEPVTVPVSDLTRGDRVRLRAGDRVPIDGTVDEGQSAVDESMLTGESATVAKATGDRVYGGTQNVDGSLIIEVTATGSDTALAQIIRVVEAAQNSRARIQRLGDRVSSVFVPIVVGLAILTALAWGFIGDRLEQWHFAIAPFLWSVPLPEIGLAAALIHAVAVLIIACPCAMGLATPIAIMAGTNVAARLGVLIRNGAALEQSGRIDMIVFDKTGTLTAGKPEIASRVHDPSEYSSDQLDGVAASLASHSRHPVSLALRRLVSDKPCLSLTGIQETPGKGLLATDPSADQTWWLGSLSWLDEQGHRVAPDSPARAADHSESLTWVGLATSSRIVALYGLRDELKPYSAEVVQQLQREGLRVMLLSGDRRSVAIATARELGLDEDACLAEVAPAQKAHTIADLQKAGHRVAFVGDGINDAPALKQADLGIAVGSASDVAKESADIILLNSEVTVIPKALELARRTLRTIHQNLFWAFFYNAAAIPLAMLGFLHPLICAAAMGASDLVVVGNALRLRVFGARSRSRTKKP